jgi:hypothetical protein
MQKRILSMLFVLLSVDGIASAQSAQTILEQALQAHGRAKVVDITTTGSVTRDRTTRNLSVYAKGSAVGRLENGSSTDRQIMIFNNGKAWAGPDNKLQPLNQLSAQRRVTLIPFLDLIDALDSPGIQITDLGVENVNGSPAHRISVRTQDADAAKRLLRRPLEEYVEFFIDVRTLLIVRSQRMRITEENLDLQVPSILDFSDYRLVNGVALPYRIVNTIGTSAAGLYQSTTVWNTVTINSGIPDTLFSPVK